MNGRSWLSPSSSPSPGCCSPLQERELRGQADAAGARRGTAWQHYALSPPARNVIPTSIYSTSGDVQNPEGLLGHGTASPR
jgi:hypothetical protein